MPRLPKSAPVMPRLRLVEARHSRKLSQQQVAERLGTTYVTVSRWERGVSDPYPHYRLRLCHLFGKTEEELDLVLNSTTQATLPEPVEPPVASAPQSFRDPATPLPPAHSLVGRARELAELTRKLQDGDGGPAIALHGLPGVGKTALVCAAVYDQIIRSHFADGILWAGLGPQPDVTGILRHWGTLLGVSTEALLELSDIEGLRVALQRAIGTRRLLLVIDDVWRVEDAIVCQIGGPLCMYLVTTRYPGIAVSLASGEATALHTLDEEESMELLRVLAPQATAHDPQQTHKLTLAAGGLPLLLALMGNYLRLKGHNRIPRRIDAALDQLNDSAVRLHLSEPFIEVHQWARWLAEPYADLSVYAVYKFVENHLSPQAQAAWYALAADASKPEGFSEQEALALAGCSLEGIDALVDAGLLEFIAPNRYRLHTVLIEYARLRLVELSNGGAGSA